MGIDAYMRYKYRLSCWMGTAFVYQAQRKVQNLGYYCYIGHPTYADYIYVETNDGETREDAIQKLNEKLSKNGAGPGDYLYIRF